jgi:NTE family protein
MKDGSVMPVAGRKSVDIVIQGSGTRAIAALGVLAELYNEGYYFERISGTSSGAIIGAVVTSYQRAGKDINELKDVIQSMDFSKFEEAPSHLRRMTGVVGDAWEAIIHGGGFTVDYLREWLTPILKDLGVTTFADLRVEDPGSHLPVSQSYSLVVHASDLSRHTWVRLPWDYPEYGHVADEQSVVEAVAASMAFPFIFQPIDFTTGSGETVTWIDGGLAANYPLSLFDRTDGKASRWPTLGISMLGEPTTRNKAVHGIPNLVKDMLLTMFDANRYGLNETGPTQHSIVVATGAVDDVKHDLDFKISHEQSEAMFEQGRKSASEFLAALPQSAV